MGTGFRRRGLYDVIAYRDERGPRCASCDTIKSIVSHENVCRSPSGEAPMNQKRGIEQILDGYRAESRRVIIRAF